MWFNVLGAVEMRDETGPVDLGPAKQRAILAVLLVHVEHPVSLDGLIDRVWGESPPASARSVVYTYMARLRRILGKAGRPVLKRGFGGYSLEVSPEAVDLHRFRALLDKSRDGESADAVRAGLLQEAIALWRGEALSGIGGQWADSVRQNLRQLKQEALVELADVRMRLGATRSVMDELRRELVEAPGAEAVARRLMRMLYEDGRSAEALDVYADTRRLLAEDYGIDPSPELRHLYDEVLRGREERRTAPVRADQISTLPMDLPDFTGRRGVLDAIFSSDRTTLAVLYGGAGMGKTVTAVHAAYRLKSRYPDGRLFVDLGAKDEPATPYAVLGRLLRGLGVGDLPVSLAERAELYRLVLSTRRTLIVLDDAFDTAQFVPLLPGTGSSAVLVTCRVRPPVPAGVATVHLTRFSDRDAREFLTRLAGPERMAAEPDATEELLALCGGVPLVLRIVGDRLMLRPQWTVSRLVRRLADDERLLAELSDGTHDFTASITSSYQRLDEPARELFKRLSALPYREFTIPAAARQLRVDREVMADGLDRLVDYHLVEFAGQIGGYHRYRVPKLHRLYAYAICERRPSMSTICPWTASP